MYRKMFMKNIAHFLTYNNAVPIFFGILFLGTTATFAASPEAREAVFAEHVAVQSVDNSYIVALDVDTFPFAVHITDITEDADTIYVTYTLDTVDVVSAVWQGVTVPRVLAVSKALLGNGDLAAYVENELTQVVAHEKNRLKETQKFERAIGTSPKVVATVYAGLVGRFFEPKEERIPQYTSQPNPNDPLFNPFPKPLVTWDEHNQPETPVATTPLEAPSYDYETEAPVVSIIGSNPAEVNVGATYSDLGAAVSDNRDRNLGFQVSLNNGPFIYIEELQVDTTVPGTHEITFKAVDGEGNVGFATRTVIVGGGTSASEVGGASDMPPEEPPAAGGDAVGAEDPPADITPAEEGLE